MGSKPRLVPYIRMYVTYIGLP